MDVVTYDLFKEYVADEYEDLYWTIQQLDLIDMIGKRKLPDKKTVIRRFMKAAVRFYSRAGNTMGIAQALADGAGVEAVVC